MDDSSTLRRLGQHLSDVDIGKILGLRKAELPQRQIASLMKCSQNAVEHALHTYSFETFQGWQSRRDYKHKTIQHKDRYIECALKQHYSLPLQDITNIVGLPISRWTVARHRDAAGLDSYIAAQKPGLRQENVEKRLEWALRYKNWTVEDWKRMIWSDESSLKIGVNPRHQWIIRPKGERLNPKYVKKTFKGEGVTVMVWACFTGERLGPLIVCNEGGIGANEYQDTLYDGLFSLIDDLLEPLEDAETIQVATEETFVFMQDNAPCHKATEVLDFLKDNRVPVMEWPPQSPDLNPMENLCVTLKATFHKRFVELFNHPSKSLKARYRYGEVLQEVWYSQGQELVDALVVSMLKRV